MEVEALTAACKEKDKQLLEVQQSLSKFKRVSTTKMNFIMLLQIVDNGKTTVITVLVKHCCPKGES